MEIPWCPARRHPYTTGGYMERKRRARKPTPTEERLDALRTELYKEYRKRRAGDASAEDRINDLVAKIAETQRELPYVMEAS